MGTNDKQAKKETVRVELPASWPARRRAQELKAQNQPQPSLVGVLSKVTTKISLPSRSLHNSKYVVKGIFFGDRYRPVTTRMLMRQKGFGTYLWWEVQHFFRRLRE